MPHPPRPDDELLSSFLDGELSAAEQAELSARLAAETALSERLAELRGAAALVSTPVPSLDPARAESLVAAALAADTTTSPAVTDLAAAAARRRSWGSRVAVAAAAVVLIALAVPALRAIDDNGDNETADAAATDDRGGDDADTAVDDGETGAELDPAEEAAGAAQAPLDDATSTADAADFDDGVADAGGADVEAADAEEATAEAPAVAELGRFADLAELRAAARSAYDDGSGSTTTTVTEPVEGDDAEARFRATACLDAATDAALDLDPDGDLPEPALTTATVADDPVAVAVFPTTPAPILVVTTAADCAVLDAVLLG